MVVQEGEPWAHGGLLRHQMNSPECVWEGRGHPDTPQMTGQTPHSAHLGQVGGGVSKLVSVLFGCLAVPAPHR